MAVIPILNLLKLPQLWRYVGFMSSVIGLLCYALSSSFKQLFGEWNLLKIFLYGVGSFIICTFMLFAKKWKLSSGVVLKAHVGFLVLMVTSVYTFFYDKAVKGKADVLGLVSCGAFAFMSFSLSRQLELGFEVDLLNFFLGCLTVQLMKINLILATVGAVFCYFFILLRSSLDTQAQQIGMVSTTDHVAVQVDAGNRLENASESDHVSNSGFISRDTNYQQELPSSHQSSNSGFVSEDSSYQQELSSRSKRKTAQKLVKLSPTPSEDEDNHSWRKYGQKLILGSKSPRSYYRCSQKYALGCRATKQVQRIQENPVLYQITYRDHHTCKDAVKASDLVTDSVNPDLKVPNEQDHPTSSSNSSSIMKQEYPKEDMPSDFIDFHKGKDTLKAPHLVTDSGTHESFLVNPDPDPSEQDHPVSSSNSSSIMKQEYPKRNTWSDLTNNMFHFDSPIPWLDLKDFEVPGPAIMTLNMASDNSADTVYSSQNLDVDFGKDEASTHNRGSNEDLTCLSQL